MWPPRPNQGTSLATQPGDQCSRRAYIDELDQEDPDEIITIVIPEFVTKFSSQWLHNQSAFAIKAKLLYRPNTVVTSVPIIVE